MEVVGGDSGAEGVVRGLGGAVRARGRIADRALGLDLGARLGFGVLAGQDWTI